MAHVFQKLIPTLRAEGHQVIAAQYGLDTLKGRTSMRPSAHSDEISGPIVLVGHSYGGTVITHAGRGQPRSGLGLYRGTGGPDETEDIAGPAGQISPKTRRLQAH